MTSQITRRSLAVVTSLLLPLATLAGALALPATSASAATVSGVETRAQFVVALAKELHLTPDTTAKPVFSDVPANDPDFGYIMAANEKGWISGFPGGTFQPNGALTREQIAKIEVVALGLQAKAQTLASHAPHYKDTSSIGQWDWGYINEATSIGILKGFANGEFGPDGTFSIAQESHALSQLEAYVTAQAKAGRSPVVTSVTPGNGSTAGGTTVTITGTRFTGATAVDFGGMAATSFHVVSDTAIIAVAPPGSGTVQVTVTTPDGTSATGNSAEFVYYTPAPHTPVTLVPTTITATPGSPVAFSSGSQTLTFTVKNQDGGAMSGVTVNFSVTGTLVASDLSATSTTTNSSGQATVTYTDSTVGDSGAVTGTVSGYPGVTTGTAILTVVTSGVTITGSDTGATTSSSTPATAGGTSATPDTTASASGGTGAVTVQSFSANPGPVTGAFASSGTYFDVSLSTSNTFTSTTIEQCGVTSSSALYWYDGTAWTAVSPTTYSGGCLTFTASSSSSPTIAQLTGTPFAVATRVPALSAAPTAAASTAVGGDTTITATPASGDTLTVQVSTTSIATPAVGSLTPTSGVTANYTSGSDLSAAPGDYVGVYEVNSSGDVVAFSEIQLTSGDVAPAPANLSVTVAPSTDAANATTITAPTASGDTLALVFMGSELPVPVSGMFIEAVPLPGKPDYVVLPYTSGSDIAEEFSPNDYVGVYELDGNGDVVGFNQVQLNPGDFASAVPALNVTAAASTDAVGDTTITATAASGDTLTVEVSASSIPAPVAGSAAPTGTGVTTDYTSGRDLAAGPGDYVGVYEVNSSGVVVAFGTTQLTSSDIYLCPTLSATPTATASTDVVGDTTITATPASGDTLTVEVSSGSIATPAQGSAAPTGTGVTTDYTSASGLAASSGDYVGVYEVDSSGDVAAFSEIGPLSPSDIAQAPANLNVTAAASTNQVGDTTITATAASGDKLTVEVSANSIATPVAGSAAPTGTGVTATYTSGNDLAASSGDYVGVYEVNSSGDVVAFSEIGPLTPSEIGSLAPSMATPLYAEASITFAGYTVISYPNVPSSVSYQSITLQLSAVQIPTPLAGSLSPTTGTGVTLNFGGAQLPATPGEYVSMYAVNSSGEVEAFGEIQLTSGEVAATPPAVSNAAVAASTSLAGYTTITATPASGDDLYVLTSSSSITTPASGQGYENYYYSGWTQYYSSGSPLAVAVGDYLGVADVNSSGDIEGFTEFGPLTASQIGSLAPALSPAPTAAASPDVHGNTTISATYASGDSLTIEVSASGSIGTPVLGSPAPTQATTSNNVTTYYISGSDLNVVVAAGDYVGVYEVDSSGNVAAFSEIQLTSGDIAAPALSPTPTASAGTQAGTTTISATYASGDSLTIVVSTSSIPIPGSGSTAPTGSGVITNYMPGSNVAAAWEDYVGVYEVNSSGDVVAFSLIGPLSSGQISSMAESGRPLYADAMRALAPRARTILVSWISARGRSTS